MPVPDLPTRILMDLAEGYCNLRCPKCYVYGSAEGRAAIRPRRGFMSLEDARAILDEVMSARPLVQPGMWIEPLMAKNFDEHIAAMKQRGLPVALNTDGLLLREETAHRLVELGVDCVFVSIDATTVETLKKVRATDKLDQIHEAVHLLLRTRADAPKPRIGVSFVVEDANEHERDSFVAHWVRHVDVVRINEVYRPDGSVRGSAVPPVRTPCKSLYETMPIHHNGDVSLCCLDAFGRHKMGNVLKEGVRGVWHGEAFRRMRHLHETGRYDQIPFCRTCDVWAVYDYQEEVREGLLIRRSPIMTYYNRIDRLGPWLGHARGGHASPAADVVIADPR
ncbi:MAG: SPASM domain-containing protein [Nitrospirae bacterium]|nr:SPASM domain-containing protein [Nitrospirota bacterium]